MASKTKTLKITYKSKFWPDYDDKIETLVGTGCDGSGMGPEGRDMDFTLTAGQYSKAVRALETSGLDLTIG